MPSTSNSFYRFGQFELDIDAGEFRQNGRRVKLQPQPFKLLVLLIRRAGNLVSREDIRAELWTDGTFVDFDQAVNFAIKQIRDAMGDSADRPLYIETVPRRGYRFIAPVETGRAAASSSAPGPSEPPTTVRLQKALWTNIAELRLAEVRRRRLTRFAIAGTLLILAALTAYVLAFVK
jgi:DNA-binding winged helix-turn-helix (wHTH) protein